MFWKKDLPTTDMELLLTLRKHRQAINDLPLRYGDTIHEITKIELEQLSQQIANIETTISDRMKTRANEQEEK